MASATLDDVITQLKFNNRSEAGRDGRHTMGLKAIAHAIVYMGDSIDEINQKTDDDKKDNEKNNKQSSAIIQGFKGVAKDMKLTDVATNIISPITGFFKSLPGAIPGGTKIVDATKAAGKKVASAFEVEKKREDQRAQKKQTSILEALYKVTVQGFKGLLAGVGKAAGFGLGALLAPLFVISGLFSQILFELKVLFKALGGMKLMSGVKNLGTGLFNAFKSLFSTIGRIIKNSKAITAIKAFFTTGLTGLLVNFVDDVIKSFVDIFRIVKEFITGSGSKVGGKVKQVFNYIKGLFSSIFKLFKPLMDGFKAGFATIKSFATTFGQVLGKIFVPITLAIAIFDSVTGFIDGFMKSKGDSDLAKILDGLGGGFAKLFGNLVGIPLDLLKKVIGWILGKMGFENAQESLASFSIKDKIMNLFTGIFGAFSDFADWIISGTAFDQLGEILTNFGVMVKDKVKEMFTNFLGLITNFVDYLKETFTGDGTGGPLGFIKTLFKGVGTLYLDFYRMILRAILPTSSGDGDGFFGFIKRAISEAIPDQVYAFAGITKSGERLSADDPTLTQATAEVEELSAKDRSASGQGDMVVTTNNIDQSVTHPVNLLRVDKLSDDDNIELVHNQ